VKIHTRGSETETTERERGAKGREGGRKGGREEGRAGGREGGREGEKVSGRCAVLYGQQFTRASNETREWQSQRCKDR
jgi:hypothetical protein